MMMEYLMLAVMTIHLIVCPYTKVEESFNMQAMHDILYHQLNISEYDHLEFPGVVPRTFLGPLVISAMAAPFAYLANLLKINKLFLQYIVRYCLGLYVLWSFRKFRTAVSLWFGPNVSFWLIPVIISQFHFMFYMTRPLPNIMALGLVFLALSAWLKRKHVQFIWFSGIAALVFRFELGILLGLYLLIAIFNQKLCITKFIRIAIPAAIVILGATVLVDSFFWHRWLWPEGEVIWFNTVLNKSSQWGTMPFFWYFYSAIPRVLSFSTVLVPVGLSNTPLTRILIIPAIVYIFIYSLLPHKEMRFIIYVFPILNVAVACVLSKAWKNRKKSLKSGLFAAFMVLHLLGNIFFTSYILYLSHHNYPGGNAILRLHQLEHPSSDVHVHIDVLSAQTGVTRFLQQNPKWRYNKTEDLSHGGPDMQSFTHLLIGASSENDQILQPYHETHTILGNIKAFHSVKLDWKLFPPLNVLTKPKIWILEKNKR